MTTDELRAKFHEKNPKARAVEPMLEKLLNSEWQKLIRPLLMKRIRLYLCEIEDYQREKGTYEIIQPTHRILQPTYYVGHPDGSYSVADPQPVLQEQ